MRPKNQAGRRRQLAEAAQRVLLRRGAVGLRVKDIAEEAGLSPSAVLYYYPEIEDLVLEVSRAAIDRFAGRRAEAVRGVDGPLRQLRLAIRLGIPTGPEDEESRLLYELDAMTGTNPAFAVLTASFFDRQVGLYEGVLSAGDAGGQLQLKAPAERLARGFVALEDGLGLQVVLGHPSVDSAEAEEVLLAYGSAATGIDLTAVPCP